MLVSEKEKKQVNYQLEIVARLLFGLRLENIFTFCPRRAFVGNVENYKMINGKVTQDAVTKLRKKEVGNEKGKPENPEEGEMITNKHK